MGKVGIICFLLIASLGQGLDVGIEEMVAPEHGEFFIRAHNDVWTYEEWSALSSFDITALRSVTQSELLVFGQQDVIENAGYTPLLAPPADFKGDLTLWIEGEASTLRVVFEPRLPSEVKTGIVNHIIKEAGHVSFQTVAYPTSIDIQSERLLFSPEYVLSIPGILWIEPVLRTEGRNAVASSLLQHGHTTETPAWDFGLNGESVIIGLADSGIDFDHACFRQYGSAAESNETSEFSNNTAVGLFSPTHRKIVLYNNSIDGYDSSGHLDYRHGTHVAGTLACYDVFHNQHMSPPSNGSSLAYASKIVFQDVVSSEGWVIPDVEDLLFEANQHGAVIHSDSWGDDTTEYTARTAMFDAYARQVPWSLAFIAPGNNGGDVLEPANGRNVASIGASVKSSTQEVWTGSARGPLEDGRDGIFVLAPGSNIISAKGDGDDTTNNADLRPSSGTSMSTPAAAGTAAIIQQMYEQGWISNTIDRSNFVLVDDLQAPWVSIPSNASSGVYLADGFTPSGTLLRATLALSTTPYDVALRNGGVGSGLLHNPVEGWGVLNLSALVDFQDLRLQLETGNATPAYNIWFHDSFQLESSTPAEWMASVDEPMSHAWNGSGAIGPFLETGQRFSSRLIPIQHQDVQIRLAFPSKPEPEIADDLLLVAHLSDGTTVVRDMVDSSGMPILYDSNVVNLSNQSLLPTTDETTQGLFIPASMLENITHIDVEILARYVAPGNDESGVGIDGNRIGFSIVASGVLPHEDNDGDGVQNIDDACPETTLGEVVDKKGCSESQNDDDNDGVANLFDLCKEEDATGFDQNFDGCIDDSDDDGFLDPEDACPFEETFGWEVDGFGCIPVDQPPLLLLEGVENLTELWRGTISLQWNVSDFENDSYETGAIIHSVENPNFVISACFFSNNITASYICKWNNPDDLPPYSLQDMTFNLRIYAQTHNNSPFASTQYIDYLHPQNFSVYWENPLEEPNDSTRDQQGVSQRIWMWSLFGIAVGFAVAFQLSKRLQDEENEGGVLDPFTQNLRVESENHQKRALHEDE
jgi:subtilisin family serine protease